MTQYAKEFEVPGHPDLHIIVVGPHDPPIDEQTLGVGLVVTAAQVQHWQTTDETTEFYLPPWPH
jgi:hypothetical protein